MRLYKECLLSHNNCICQTFRLKESWHSNYVMIIYRKFLRAKLQLNHRPMRCAPRLIEKQVKDLRCPAAVMRSRPQYVTGKPGRRGRTRKQSQKNCLIGPLYHPCERQEGAMRLYFVYLFAGRARRLFAFWRLWRSGGSHRICRWHYWKRNVDVWIRTLFP